MRVLCNLRGALRFVSPPFLLCFLSLSFGTAYAAETIYACAHKNVGDIRVVSAPGQCLKSEYEVSWEDGLALRRQINELLGRVSSIESALGVLKLAPSVLASGDQTILVSMTATLDGTAEDDGLVRPLSFLWEDLLNSPAVVIDEPNSLSTIVRFTAAGEYDFRLSVSDGAVTVSDELRIIVYPNNDPPTIVKDADPLIIPAIRVRDAGYWTLYCPEIDLGVKVTDEGLPSLPSFDWSIDSTVVYPGSTNNYNRISAGFNASPSDSVEWPLHMAAKNLYVGYPVSYLPLYVTATLSLDVSDGYHAVEDSLVVQCDVRASPAPVVEAGAEQTIAGSAISGGYLCIVPLAGTVEDDGRPEPLSILWGVTNYSPWPDSTWWAAFSPNPKNSAETTGYFNVRERYTGANLPESVTFSLLLRAEDGYSTTEDHTAVTCTKP